ncbi:MAG: hypothetical protein [Olavius algarvensis Gamma 1 endosymbiont]|nr:MAG: hypothetical protein [Olavius algarvensis Gamma 1 endosymbiont]
MNQSTRSLQKSPLPGFLRLPGFGQGVIGRRKLRNDKNPVNPV